MLDPWKKRYLYSMLAGFGAISLSVILFFILYRMQGISQVLGRIGEILSPFVYGGVIAYLLRPMCNSLENFFQEKLPKKVRRFSNGLSVMLSLMTGVFLVYALIIMIAPQLYTSLLSLWNSIPGAVERLIAWAKNTFGEDERLIQFLNDRYVAAYSDLDTWFRDTFIPKATSIVSGVGISVWSFVRSLYNLLIGLIVSVYLLHGRKRFAEQSTLIVRSALPDRWADLLIEEVRFIDRMFAGFIDGKIIDSAIIGLLCYIGCSLLRIPNTLLVSVFVGVTNIIPFFGPVIGAVPSTLLVLIESPIKAVWFVIFVLVLQQLDGNVIGPKILGNRTGLPGFWVLFSIILFGGLWGIVGMVICVPVFAVIYDLVKRLVRRGLKRQGRVELWEKYQAQYPEDGETKTVQEGEKA